jgi:hypothetical protein
MLNLFGEIKVPGVDNVIVYADDEDDRKYYMLATLPTIKTAPDGRPMFTLIVAARDFYLFKDRTADLQSQETELGLLSLTTGLTVSETDQQKIKAYLAGRRSYFRPVWIGGRVARQLVMQGRDPSEIVLAYPTWVDSADPGKATKVAFSIVPAGGDTFVKAVGGSDKPAMMLDNEANYQALLGQEGVELLRQGVDKGFTMANVAYQVSFVARLPSIHISVTGDAKRVYSEIKEHCQVVERYSNGSIWSYPAVSSLHELQTTFAEIHIQYDDADFTSASGGAGGAADDAKKAVEDFVLQTVTDYIKNTFFAPPFTPGVQPEKLGGDPFTHNPWKDPNTQPTQPNQLWLKDFSQGMEGSFGFVADYRKNITVTKYPNAMLFGLAPPAAIKGGIVEADLSQPYFQVLDVPVKVTADFDNDPIAAILVTCRYEQVDDATGIARSHAEEFKFETGKEAYRFQTVMAKARDGTPKDEFTYSSKVVYKSSANPVETVPTKTRERNLVLGYNQLSCVRVQAVWGAVPTDTVSRVQIHFEYPDPALTVATKTKDVFLAPDHASDSWFTYTGGNASQEYSHQLTYFLVGGQTLALPAQRSSQPSLVINAPFEDTLTVTFVPQGQFPPTQQIVVSARYADQKDGYTQSDVHTFSGLGDTWKWQVRLHDRTQRNFQYKVDVTFNDGSSDTGVWKDGVEGTLLVGEIAQKIMQVDVVPALLDLARVWKLVIVKLSYEDPDHNVDQSQTFELTAATGPGPLTWKVAIKDQKKKTYSYEIDAYGYDPSQVKKVGPLPTDDAALVLQL